MPKTTHRISKPSSSNNPTTNMNNGNIHNRTPATVEHNSVTITGSKWIVVYEHNQTDQHSRHTRLQISRRGELGPPRTHNHHHHHHCQHQDQARADTVIINNDRGGLIVGAISTTGDADSCKIVITNSDH